MAASTDGGEHDQSGGVYSSNCNSGEHNEQLNLARLRGLLRLSERAMALAAALRRRLQVLGAGCMGVELWGWGQEVSWLGLLTSKFS